MYYYVYYYYIVQLNIGASCYKCLFITLYVINFYMLLVFARHMQALNRYQETFIDASFYFYGSPHSMYRRKSGDSSWAHCSAPDASPGVRTDLQDLPEYHVLRAG